MFGTQQDNDNLLAPDAGCASFTDALLDHCLVKKLTRNVSFCSITVGVTNALKPVHQKTPIQDVGGCATAAQPPIIQHKFTCAYGSTALQCIRASLAKQQMEGHQDAQATWQQAVSGAGAREPDH